MSIAERQIMKSERKLKSFSTGKLINTGFLLFLCFTTLLTLGFAHTARGGDQLPYKSLGRGSRLFVTKCYPDRGCLTDKDFQQLSDAGFNVVINRWQKDVQAYCKGAAKAGLDVMIWHRGMMLADNPADRHITRIGKPRKFLATCNAAGWKKLTKKMLKQAKLSLTCRNYRGVCLDFEVYGGDKTGGYCESYDDENFTRFLKLVKHDIPNPLTPPNQRYDYLKQQGLLGAYIGEQEKLVAKYAADLRKQVDTVNPYFQFGVYQRGPFIEAVRRNLATSKAPLLLLSSLTYGRSLYSRKYKGGYDGNVPDRKGLKINLITAGNDVYRFRDCGYPVIVLAGHDPYLPGPVDQYTFTARQAFNSAAYADGYWIWNEYTLPSKWKSGRQAWIDSMMKAFKQANTALDVGDYTWASRYPEKIKDTQALKPQLIATSDGKSCKLWNPLTGESIDPETEIIRLPQSDPMLEGKKIRVDGQRVEVVEKDKTVKSFPVGAGVRAVAVGDVDGQPGPEIVTLNRGWVKIWDPQSQVLLLRFFVGHNQSSLWLKEQ